MKLHQLFLSEEDLILSSPMNEMANLFPDETGLQRIIWFGEVGGQHGPRIKVSNIKGKFSQSDNFVISVDKNPKVLTPKSMKIKTNELEDLFDWVKLNYDDLMKMWKMYETGTGSPNQILMSLKKI